MRISYLDGPRLRRVIIAGAEAVGGRRAQLDAINVFPVPDGDTGTNMARTLEEAVTGLRDVPAGDLPELARRLADAAVMGSRGNSGLILSHFFLGLSQAIGERERLRGAELAEAMEASVRALYDAIEDPVEGTILTVMRASAEAARRAAGRSDDLGDLLESALATGREALARTPDQLAVLREAGVVDAGAQGFVWFLEGMVEFLHRGDARSVEEPVRPVEEEVLSTAAARARLGAGEEGEDLRLPFCTEVTVRGSRLPEVEVRRRFTGLGASLVVAATPRLCKVHVHTDRPERVYAEAERLGEVVARKAEDMREQHRRAQAAADRVGIVVDSTAGLPADVLERERMVCVPLRVQFGEESLRDGVDIDADGFYRRLASGGPHPTTSQPSPGDFAAGFRQAGGSEAVLAVTLAAKLSGTHAAAAAAARQAAGVRRIEVFDSRSASIGTGLLALRARQWLDAGRSLDEVVEGLRTARERLTVLFTLPTLTYLARGGRIGRAKALLGNLLGLQPILGVRDAEVVPVDRVKGRGRLLPRVLELLAERVAPGSRVHAGAAHAGCPEALDPVEEELRRRYRVERFQRTPMTPVIGAHAGPGGWGVCVLPLEDRTG